MVHTLFSGMSLSVVLNLYWPFSGLYSSLIGDAEGITGGKVTLRGIFRGDKHLLGQHTVRLSPIRYEWYMPQYIPNTLLAPQNWTHIWNLSAFPVQLEALTFLFSSTIPIHNKSPTALPISQTQRAEPLLRSRKRTFWHVRVLIKWKLRPLLQLLLARTKLSS